MLKLIVAIFIGLSFRSANEVKYPYDYEISGGLKTAKYGYIEALTERENGEHYKGLDWEAYPSRYLTLKWLCKEAKEINSQTIDVHYPIGVLKIGLVENWQGWEDRRSMLGLGLDLGFLKARYQTNFDDRKAIELDLSREFEIGNNYYIEPVFKAYSGSNKKFWQVKLRFVWKK